MRYYKFVSKNTKYVRLNHRIILIMMKTDVSISNGAAIEKHYEIVVSAGASRHNTVCVVCQKVWGKCWPGKVLWWKRYIEISRTWFISDHQWLTSLISIITANRKLPTARQAHTPYTLIESPQLGIKVAYIFHFVGNLDTMVKGNMLPRCRLPIASLILKYTLFSISLRHANHVHLQQKQTQ